MKALTVQQPWAAAIFHGKDIENRSTIWKYRGPIAIHAGRRYSDRGMNSPLVQQALTGRSGPGCWDAGIVTPQRWTQLGAIIGVVDCVDIHLDGGCCRPWGESSYREADGRERTMIAHMVLENPRSLGEPIPCKGALGLWTPPPAIVAALKEQVTL